MDHIEISKISIAEFVDDIYKAIGAIITSKNIKLTAQKEAAKALKEADNAHSREKETISELAIAKASKNTCKSCVSFNIMQAEENSRNAKFACVDKDAKYNLTIKKLKNAVKDVDQTKLLWSKIINTLEQNNM